MGLLILDVDTDVFDQIKKMQEEFEEVIYAINKFITEKDNEKIELFKQELRFELVDVMQSALTTLYKTYEREEDFCENIEGLLTAHALKLHKKYKSIAFFDIGSYTRLGGSHK